MLKLFMKNKKGFTLVELMVVVVILGILVAIAIPVYNSTTTNAQTKACEANQRTITGAITQYRSVNPANDLASKNAGDLTTALVPSYLATWPVCPSGGVYSSDASSVVDCSAAGH